MKIPLKRYWRLFAAYLKPQWRRVSLLALLLFGGIGLQVASPQLLRYFIDTARAGGSTRILTTAALLFIGATLLQQALMVIAAYVSENVAWLATNALRHDLARHCLDLDMSFHNTHTPGELIERIDGDVTTLANFFSELVIQVLGNGLLTVGVLLMLFRVDWRIGLALTAFAAAMLVLLNRIRGIATPAWIAGRRSSADFAGFLEERLAGTEDIRSSRATDFVMRQFYGLMRAIMLNYRRAHVRGAIAVGVAHVGFTAALAIGLGLGAYLYQQGEVSLGAVFLTGYYASVLTWPLEEIADQMNDLQQASAGLTRVEELRAVPIAIQDGRGTAAWDRRAGLPSGPLSLEFERVSFAYRGLDGAGSSGEPVLKDVSFCLQPGEVLGLLGRTGSGKTTIARLLFRLYDARTGSIRLGGVDIREVRLSELRRRIGLVTQEVQLFHATVRENLTFFDSRISDDRLLEAIHALALDSWYRSLPHGLDTSLSGSGGLSAGEAQVLAMTRVFLKDPALVILDEASSRLDPATERLIESAVDRLLRGRTAIVIAHRLATVRRADQIVILQDGAVCERGLRAELAADPRSRFAHLLRAGLELEPAS